MLHYAMFLSAPSAILRWKPRRSWIKDGVREQERDGDGDGYGDGDEHGTRHGDDYYSDVHIFAADSLLYLARLSSIMPTTTIHGVERAPGWMTLLEL